MNTPNSQPHNVIVIGASAGGLEPLQQIARELPSDLHASILVVVHTAVEGPGLLASILARDTGLIALKAKDGMGIDPGRIYVAPPDKHMLVEPGRIRLDRGPTENRHRPAIDPLFRSAATAYGPSVVAVVLSGYLDDGTRGLQVVKAHGGVAIVQDPEDASVPSMPLSAMKANTIDHVLAASDIAPVLVQLANGSGTMAPRNNGNQNKSRREQLADSSKPSVFTCPDCHGSLWEVEEQGLTHYRCRIGHVYSVDSLAEGQRDSVERAMWAAVRSLEEDAELADRMYQTATRNNRKRIAERFLRRTEASRQNADVIRGILLRENSPASHELSVDGSAKKADDSAA